MEKYLFFSSNSIVFSPRGLAGSLLVIKVAGALAEQGKNMSEIVDVCQQVREQLRTIGLSASGIRVPGQQQSFEVDLRKFFVSKNNLFS
jgi:dihydroxyacetone kinase